MCADFFNLKKYLSITLTFLCSGGSERSGSAKVTSKTDATAPYLDLRFGWPMGVVDPTEKAEKEGKKKK